MAAPEQPSSDPVTLALRQLYHPSTPISIADLSFADMSMYAFILSRRTIAGRLDTLVGKEAKAAYVFETKSLISKLPAHLLDPSPNLVSGSSRACSDKAFQQLDNAVGDVIPRPSALCKIHHHLCGQVIADLLCVVEMEIEDFLPDLLNSLGGRQNLEGEILNMVKCLEEVAASWLIDQEFSHFYRRSPQRKWANASHSETGEHGCDACVLALVGSDPEVICALRAVMLARMPEEVLSGKKRSPRLEWISAWLKTMPCNGVDALMKASRVGKELRDLSRGQKVMMHCSSTLPNDGYPLSARARPLPLSNEAFHSQKSRGARAFNGKKQTSQEGDPSTCTTILSDLPKAVHNCPLEIKLFSSVDVKKDDAKGRATLDEVQSTSQPVTPPVVNRATKPRHCGTRISFHP